MKAVVLCGGLGTRLGALTRATPKPLIDVAGKPFINYVLDQLAASGTTEVVLAVSFQWQKLRDSLGESWQGVPLHYSVEPEPLGTGGAVRHAMNQMGWVEAIVANGDTLLKMDSRILRDTANHFSADIVMALKWIDDVSRYGSVSLGPGSRVIAFEEKGQSGEGLVNAGLYWIKASVFDRAPDGVFSLERDLMAEHVTKLAMYGVETSGYFVDMGIPEDLERARREMS
jgi:D-glycero-alpha-D-manno-heptose 1-phosphate guanylyltransferase